MVTHSHGAEQQMGKVALTDMLSDFAEPTTANLAASRAQFHALPLRVLCVLKMVVQRAPTNVWAAIAKCAEGRDKEMLLSKTVRSANL